MESPPLLVSFSNIEQFLNSLDDKSQAEYGTEISQLVEQGLPPAVSFRCLATLFGYSLPFLQSMHSNPEKYYRTFQIASGKKRRVIRAPRVSLKVIQKWLGHHLSEAVAFDNSVYGFVKGRSAIDAAAAHCGAKWVYSIDIENFFPSTSTDKVKQALVVQGYSEHAATIIAKLSSYEGNLAQGSPASPFLSNLVFRNADQAIFDIADRYSLVYTRYADDIVISGKSDFPEQIKSDLAELIHNEGWIISANKEHFAMQPNRLKVHGLLVHGDSPRLTKGYRNKVRAFKHLLQTGKVKESDAPRLRGHVAFSDAVDSKQ